MINPLKRLMTGTVIAMFLYGYVFAFERDKASKKNNIVKQVPDSCNILLSITVADILCNGDNNGSIIVSVTGGAPPLLFSIDGGNTYQLMESFNNLSHGEYAIMVKDDHHCTASGSATLLNPAPVSIDLGADRTMISGEVILFDAGSGYADYLWSTGETTQTISFTRTTEQPIDENLSVNVTGKNGCKSSSNTVKITINPQVQDNEPPPAPETIPLPEPVMPDSEPYITQLRFEII